jgi:hypothetical protein
MKPIFLAAAFVLFGASSLAAQSLNDQVTIGNDALFIQRVRQALINAAINISSDGLSTGINLKRHAQVQSILNNPDGWKQLFAEAIATQSAVMNPATVTGTVVLKPMICPGGVTTASCTETGNVDTQQALVTDAVINTNVSAVFNAFFGGQ